MGQVLVLALLHLRKVVQVAQVQIPRAHRNRVQVAQEVLLSVHLHLNPALLHSVHTLHLDQAQVVLVVQDQVLVLLRDQVLHLLSLVVHMNRMNMFHHMQKLIQIVYFSLDVLELM